MKKLLLLLLCMPLIYSCENNKVKNINFEQIDDEEMDTTMTIPVPPPSDSFICY